MIEVSEGHRLAVRRRGNGGVPLLLIHGFPCTSRIWSHNIVPLAEAGFDVVAPDLRGYGDSDFAPDDFYDSNAFNTKPKRSAATSNTRRVHDVSGLRQRRPATPAPASWSGSLCRPPIAANAWIGQGDRAGERTALRTLGAHPSP